MKQQWFRALFRRRILIVLLLVVQALFLVLILNNSSRTSTIITWILTAVSFLVALSIISKRDKGSFKLIWVFLILLFPIFGGLFYLLVNYQSSVKRFSKKVSRTENKAKELLALPGTGYEMAAESIPEHMPQIQYLEKFAGFPVYTDSTTKFLSPGEVKFEYLLEELEKAEKYIFLEYFIVQEGVMWNAVLEILKRKATQGVLVRLMYDDMGCFFLLPKDYPKQLKKFGIECVIFNRFKPLLTTIQNNRDHRKIASIDGKVAFTGGINLADEYINEYEKHGHWKDASIMIKGKAAWSLTLMFLQMWELSTGTDEDHSIYYPWQGISCPVQPDGFVQPYGGTVGIQGVEGIVVIYFDVVSVSSAPGVDSVGDGDGSVCGRKDGGSSRSADVGSAVVGNLPSEGVLPVAEPRGNGVALRKGPLEDTGSLPIGVGIHDLSAAACVTAQQLRPQILILWLRHQGKVFVLPEIEAVLPGHFLRRFMGDGNL